MCNVEYGDIFILFAKFAMPIRSECSNRRPIFCVGIFKHIRHVVVFFTQILSLFDIGALSTC